jgi:hypothetical protein
MFLTETGSYEYIWRVVSRIDRFHRLQQMQNVQQQKNWILAGGIDGCSGKI